MHIYIFTGQFKSSTIMWLTSNESYIADIEKKTSKYSKRMSKLQNWEVKLNKCQNKSLFKILIQLTHIQELRYPV